MGCFGVKYRVQGLLQSRSVIKFPLQRFAEVEKMLKIPERLREKNQKECVISTQSCLNGHQSVKSYNSSFGILSKMHDL